MAKRASVRWVGVVAGVIAVGVVGFVAGRWHHRHFGPATLVLPDIPLEAAASDSSDKFAIATGPVGGDVEGVFLLDPVQGELTCFVLGRRLGRPTPAGVGQVVAQFKTATVYDDLQITDTKSARLLMVTGISNFMGTSRTTRMGGAVVYIVDGSTGKFVAYGTPWNTSAYTSNHPQAGPFIKLASGSVRHPNLIRE